MKVPVEVDTEVLEKAMEASGARSPEDLVRVALQGMSFNKWMKDTFRLARGSSHTGGVEGGLCALLGA